MGFIKIVLSLAILTSAVPIVSAQTVTISESARLSLPGLVRDRLPAQLQHYLRAFKKGDMNQLFDLMSERARRGMSRDEFVRTTKVDAKAEHISKFQIHSVQEARRSDYIDESEPGPGEGVKWLISGCARVSIAGAKPRNLEQGFDVWLVDGEWFVRRGGLRIDGGYRECKFL